jgi:hypothetical protein
MWESLAGQLSNFIVSTQQKVSMPSSARVRKTSQSKPDEGTETKAQRKARLAANRQAHELAAKYALPALAGFLLSVAALLFYLYGLGESGKSKNR